MTMPKLTGAILAPISAGELLDKIAILEIKSDRIGDQARLALVREELRLLEALREKHIPETAELTAEYAELKQVNSQLWEIEDRLRKQEFDKRFDQQFIELARSVYVTNDRRAAIKLRINISLGSAIVEVKSYAHSGLTQQ